MDSVAVADDDAGVTATVPTVAPLTLNVTLPPKVPAFFCDCGSNRIVAFSVAGVVGRCGAEPKSTCNDVSVFCTTFTVTSVDAADHCVLPGVARRSVCVPTAPNGPTVIEPEPVVMPPDDDTAAPFSVTLTDRVGASVAP